MNNELLDIEKKIESGLRISRANAEYLWKNANLTELGRLAQKVRFKLHPENRVTFLIDRNINYTNVCNSDCSFCAFYRHDPRDPESYVLSKPVIEKKVTEALEHGATRILLQGGHNDELPYEYYVDLISWLHTNFKIELNSFSPSEIDQMTKVSGKSPLEILTELKAAGMAGLPGGGAEILDDEIRKRISPKKIPAARWLSIMEDAHSLNLTTTATMVIGFGETLQHRLNHLEKLRDIQDKALQNKGQGFNSFIAWTHQFNENTSLGRSRHVAKFGAEASEYLKHMALSRIFLDNFQHVQSSWPTLGIDVAAIGLHFGCDDIGSTMMEENVVSQAGALTRERWSMTPEELVYHIQQAGFEAAQRDSSFSILKVYDGTPQKQAHAG